MPTLEQIVNQYYPPRKMLGLLYLPDLSPLDGLDARCFLYPAPTFSLTKFQTLQNGVVVGHQAWIWGLTASGVHADGSAASFRIMLRDGRTRQPLFMTPLNDVNAVGTGQRPYFLPTLHPVPSMRQIDVQVTDTSGVASTVQVVLCTAILD